LSTVTVLVARTDIVVMISWISPLFFISNSGTTSNVRCGDDDARQCTKSVAASP
jgi:hypothetical protein